MRFEYLIKGGSNIGHRLAKMVPEFSVFVALVLIIATSASADVSLTDRKSYAKQMKSKGTNLGIAPKATGSVSLTDGSGLQWFFNDNITFNTTSSASGAASEASYVAPVSATTQAGGVVSATLNDAFDGYNSICISTTPGKTGPCSTSDAAYTVYYNNGAATIDATCAGGRQVLFSPQTIGNLTVSRKVFVPDNDSFARWQNIVTNNGATPRTVTLITANNLGSDSNTIITGTSSGNLTAEVADTWVTSMQNYALDGTSTDPRLGHVLRGPGSSVGLAGINFVDGDDNPFWGYTFTLAPGETKIIVNFATGQPSKAAAAAKAAELANLTNPNALTCMSATDKSRVANFSVEPPTPVSIPAMGQWGMIIFVVLSGLGSIYFFRRQKSRG